MTLSLTRLALIAASALTLAPLSGVTMAATPAAPGPAKPTAAAARPGAQPAKPAARTAARGKKAVPPPVEPPPPPEADEEQLAAADKVYQGLYECEFKQAVEIVTSPRHKGYVDVRHLKSVWLMKPVLSSTGAIRLEHVRGETLMVQISSKSMLLNVKTGQRIVDDCVSPRQRELIDAARVTAVQAAAAASAAPGTSAPSGAEATAASAPAAAASAASAAIPAGSVTPMPAETPASAPMPMPAETPASAPMPMPAASAR